MTILYDSGNHLRLIFSCHGTALHRGLPLSMISFVIAYLIFYFIEEDDIGMDSGYTLSKEQGYQFLLTLIAFLIVTRFVSAHERMWDARMLLDEVIEYTHNVALLADTLTRDLYLDASAATQNKDQRQTPSMQSITALNGIVKWRTLIKIRLVNFLQSGFSIVSSPKDTVDYVMKFDTGEDTDQVLTGNDTTDVMSMSGNNPNAVAKSVHQLIYDHELYLNATIPPPAELKLHRYLDRATLAYSKTVKFSSTPIPYPICHLVKLLLVVFTIVTPSVLVYEFKSAGYDYAIIPALICFVTVYGFSAIEAITLELDDPFGDDPNDLELKGILDSAAIHVLQALDAPVTEQQLIEKANVYIKAS